ncbi:Na+/H+ antiporter NhaC family protein [soil metagenome]
MKRRRSAFLLGALLLPWVSQAGAQTPPSPPRVEAPAVALPGAPLPLTATLPDAAPETPYRVRAADGAVLAAGILEPGENRVEGVTIASADQLPLRLETTAAAVPVAPRFLPGWLSLVPPLLAIVLALIFREVVVSLFAGVWLGAFFWTGFDPLSSLLRVADTFALPALADADHAAIVIFSLLIGGMVGVIGRNGGTFGIVERLAPYATTPRRGMLATYAQGLAIFFDDYANTLIVGNTMRPVTDRLRISREKLAYIVDSTAAPISSVVLVSTWVGYEISLISDGLKSAATAVATDNPALSQRLAEASAFNVFIDTIPYRFYPLLALAFVLFVIVLQRDFGPMREAEARAASGAGVFREGATLLTDTSGGAMEPPEGTPLRWWNAGIPVGVVVAGVLAGLYGSGSLALGPGEHALREVFGAANSFHVLLWASLGGSVAAIVLTLAQRVLTLQETMDAWGAGMRAMLVAMIILMLAWSLQSVTEVLGTAQYLSSAVEGNVSVHFLPVIVFAIAALISLATGSSWGTMAILLPLVIPLGATLSAAADVGTSHYTILLGVTSSVLAGSIFGDHCSPISDTTVLSSMASACDHSDHVRTQLPYAMVVAFVGMLLGDIPTAYGLSPWISLAAGALVLAVIVRFVGKPVEPAPAHGAPSSAPAAAVAAP